MKKILLAFIVLLSAGICTAQSPDMSKSVVMIQTVKQGYDYTTPWKQTSTAGWCRLRFYHRAKQDSYKCSQRLG